MSDFTKAMTKDKKREALATNEPEVTLVTQRRGIKVPTLEMGIAAVKVLAQGRPWSFVAEAVGVGEAKLKSWIEEGQREGADPAIVQFAEMCLSGRQAGRDKKWGELESLAQIDSKVALRLAEAAYPEDFAPAAKRGAVEERAPEGGEPQRAEAWLMQAMIDLATPEELMVLTRLRRRALAKANAEGVE